MGGPLNSACRVDFTLQYSNERQAFCEESFPNRNGLVSKLNARFISTTSYTFTLHHFFFVIFVPNTFVYAQDIAI